MRGVRNPFCQQSKPTHGWTRAADREFCQCIIMGRRRVIRDVSHKQERTMATQQLNVQIRKLRERLKSNKSQTRH